MESVPYEAVEDGVSNEEAAQLMIDALDRAYLLRDNLPTNIWLPASRCMQLALLFQSAADVAAMYPASAVKATIECERDIVRRLWMFSIVLIITTGQSRRETVSRVDAERFTMQIELRTHFDSARLKKPPKIEGPVKMAEKPKRRMNFRPKAGLKLISNDPPVKVGE